MPILLASNGQLAVSDLVMHLLGGVALFLYGMDRLSDALKNVAGEHMKTLLVHLTSNRFKSAGTGALVTAIIQSSSVTTVLVVGFLASGALTLKNSIGVILGANVGTTITAQILAFKITHYALAFVALGFGLLFFSRNRTVQSYGTLLFGLGLIFFGMQVMSDATSPLRDAPGFIDLMRHMRSPALGILAGAVFTGIVQSSSASTGIVILLASQGFITLEAGIALSFGANIGTCVTALLACLGKPREALQGALVHLLFNVVGVLLWMGFIGQLGDMVRAVSPTFPALSPEARLAAETPRQIANAHTAFNLINALLFLGFVGPYARFIQWLAPVRPSAEPAVVKPRYLDDVFVTSPPLALDRVRMELEHLASWVGNMIRKAPMALTARRSSDLAALQGMDDDVDRLHEAIIRYLSLLSQEELSARQSRQLSDYLEVAHYMENIGDLIKSDMVEHGLKRLQAGLQPSPAAGDLILRLHAKVAWAFDTVTRAVGAWDPHLASQVNAAKAEINDLADEAQRHLLHSLPSRQEPGRLLLHRIEADLVEELKRVYYLTKRIAKVVQESADGHEEEAVADPDRILPAVETTA